jgi:hypothetical protein
MSSGSALGQCVWALSVVLIMLSAGCAGTGAQGDPTPTPQKGATVDMPSPGTPSGLGCGARFEAPPPAELSLTARFPASVVSGKQPVPGRVDVVSRTGSVSGVITPAADAFLVRDGIIVSEPLPQDLVGRRLQLEADESVTLPAQVSLLTCDDGDSGDAVLPAGRYDLYVRVVLNHDDGTASESIGDPRPLVLR